MGYRYVEVEHDVTHHTPEQFGSRLCQTLDQLDDEGAEIVSLSLSATSITGGTHSRLAQIVVRDPESRPERTDVF